ncbi:MAG: GNAT family N-acetyltransferase [Promethearchaeota archaeon]
MVETTGESVEKMNMLGIAPFIEGEHVDLLPLNEDNFALYTKWENLPDVRKYSRNVFPLTKEDYKKLIGPPNGKIKKFIPFEIWHKRDKKPIGTCEVSEINWINRHAYLGILIGEQSYWNQNLCTEVAKLLTKYAFEEMNLKKLYWGAFNPNLGSQRCCEKAGFKLEATLKNDIYIDGKYFNTLIYSLFRKDWLNEKSGRIN